MNFFKKNKMLSLALLLTVIISTALIVMDFLAYFKFKAETAEIAANVATIENATKKKPAPLKENMAAIDQDIKTLSGITKDLQRRFGKFYRIPLIHFAETLKVTEDDLLAAFRSYYDGLPEEKQGDAAGANDEEILENFLKLYYMTAEEDSKETAAGADSEEEESDTELTPKQQAAKDKVDEAVDAFGKEVAAISMAYDGNPVPYLLEALGLPRSIQTNNFKKELNKVQKNLLDKQIIPGVVSESQLIDMTFDSDDLPPQREIYMALREMQIRTDLFKRLSKNKMRDVRSLSAAIPLAGEPIENDVYIKYTYTIEMNGMMDNIRNFINDLSDAYKDNLVYVVRDLSLKRPFPEDIEALTEISDGTKGLKGSAKSTKSSRSTDPVGMNPARMRMQQPTALPAGMNMPVPSAAASSRRNRSSQNNMPGMPAGMPGMAGGMMPGMDGYGYNNNQNMVDEESGVPLDYGQPVVGVDKSVDCVLTVDFLMYVGEEVKRVLPEEPESDTSSSSSPSAFMPTMPGK